VALPPIPWFAPAAGPSFAVQASPSGPTPASSEGPGRPQGDGGESWTGGSEAAPPMGPASHPKCPRSPSEMSSYRPDLAPRVLLLPWLPLWPPVAPGAHLCFCCQRGVVRGVEGLQGGQREVLPVVHIRRHQVQQLRHRARGALHPHTRPTGVSQPDLALMRWGPTPRFCHPAYRPERQRCNRLGEAQNTPENSSRTT
jgi:hypothetical protein